MTLDKFGRHISKHNTALELKKRENQLLNHFNLLKYKSINNITNVEKTTEMINSAKEEMKNVLEVYKNDFEKFVEFINNAVEHLKKQYLDIELEVKEDKDRYNYLDEKFLTALLNVENKINKTIEEKIKKLETSLKIKKK